MKEERYVRLPEGFWQDYYRKEYGQSPDWPCIPSACLNREKSMRIVNERLDCMPFAHMEELKELVIHHRYLENFAAVADMPQLKRLILVDCDFDSRNLPALSGAKMLKEISLNQMDARELVKLKDLSSLKILRLRRVTGIRIRELEVFTGLKELSLDEMGICDGSFIGKMKGLKKLDLHWHALNDLDFLKQLPGLVNFQLCKRAENEDGLSAVKNLTKLREFLYPVKDLSLYKGHPALEAVGISGDVEDGFEVFQGSRVRSFTAFGVSEKKLKWIEEQMSRYVNLSSYTVLDWRREDI